MDAYCAPHHMKAKSAGKPAYALPLVLFSDDTSGNKSMAQVYVMVSNTSWFVWTNSFESMQHTNLFVNVVQTIYVHALELGKPIAEEELLLLKTPGIEVCGMLNNQMVIVVAPLICIMADNPMASEIKNYLRGAANNYTAALVR